MHKKFYKLFYLNLLCLLLYCEMGNQIKVQVQFLFFSLVQQRPQKIGKFTKSKFNFGNLTTNEPGPCFRCSRAAERVPGPLRLRLPCALADDDLPRLRGRRPQPHLLCILSERRTARLKCSTPVSDVRLLPPSTEFPIPSFIEAFRLSFREFPRLVGRYCN